jgi:hypothetical protein
MYNSAKELIVYDFDLIPNQNLGFNTLAANDIISLYLSSINHSRKKAEEVAKVIINTYNPTDMIKEQIEYLINKNLLAETSSLFKYFREKFFYLPIFEMKEKEVHNNQNILLRHL